MNAFEIPRTWALRELVETFWANGYVRLPGAFTAVQVEHLRETILACGPMTTRFRETQEKFLSGKYPSFETIFVWNDTSGDDIFAKFTRSALLMSLLDAAFEDEAYVYHNKVALKYPRMPGFKHHQDYFYWYSMGCLYPSMATCFIAIDPADRENGCLRLVRGSHKLGRLEHKTFDTSDSSVDPDRLAVIIDRMPDDEIEMAPGDAVMFHCNTIHSSEANLTNRSRLALLGCYNTKRNSPYMQACGHPPYIKQSMVMEGVTTADRFRLPDFALNYTY